MRWNLILISYFSLFTLGFVDNARGPLYPLIINHLQITLSSGSLFFTLASIFGLLTSIFGRQWLTKFGALKSLRAFAILQLIGTLGTGAFPNSFFSLLFFSSIYGISLGGTGISLNILVARASSPKNRRRAFAGLHSMYAIASILSPMIVAFLLLKNILWNEIFLYFSILPFLFCLATFIKQKDYHDTKQPSKPKAIRNSAKVITAGIFAPYVAAEIIISSRLPLFLNKYHHFTTEKSSQYLGYFFIFLLLGRATFSLIHFNVKSKNLLKVSIIGSLIFLILGIYYNPIYLCLCGLSMSFYYPCALDYVTETFPNKIDEITSWIMIAIGSFLILIHGLFGVLSQHFGIKIAFSFGIILLSTTFVFLNINLKDE